MDSYKVIDSHGKEISTSVSLHPGEVLLMEIDTRGLKKTQVAESLGIKASHFSELLHGKRHVGASLALRLENLLGISAEFWMRVQVTYDLFEERKKQSNRKGRPKIKKIIRAATKKAV